ncbi:MAG: DUF1501 domain-containing protein [Chloroflexi bacterium]|nr:DUF1501 domain-containing protein [Chloroflexota bacterium]MXX66408.1 DUF1501 domain-containing protein [Chloroflexota bacterium]MYC47169.1 DUF1501 domain-containing protein [Chloroflexota bacterium]
MAANGKPPVLVVLQLTGGNDFMNSVVPYNSPVYYDARQSLAIAQEDVLPIDGELGFHPNLAPLKELYDEGTVAIVQGVGYQNSSRSHFRAMDIMHTCEPEIVGTEGWVGRATRQLDPERESVLTTVNIGRGMPRALACPGVPITSVGDLDSYGLMSGISALEQRSQALTRFQEMYAPAIGSGPVADYIARTGLDVIKGAEILKAAPAAYQSRVTYAENAIAQSLRDVARVHLAGLGTRIFYAQHGGYDTHAIQNPTHPRLLSELSGAIRDFFQDLRDHDADDEVAMLVFTEFGRRMRGNGSGTDHGSGGGAFIIGKNVNGGLYCEYPSLNPNDWLNGEDLRHTVDFRSVYSVMLEKWMKMDPTDIVGGSYEQFQPFKQAGSTAAASA